MKSNDSIWIGQLSVYQVYEWAGVFSKARYMIVVGFKLLIRTCVPKYPRVTPWAITVFALNVYAYIMTIMESR